MKESTDVIDVNGKFVMVGDTVHCWDGDVDQREVTQSLRGVVNFRKTESVDQFFVGDNGLALSCAEHVEIITNK